jgi:phospholipid N-methyltransferase
MTFLLQKLRDNAAETDTVRLPGDRAGDVILMDYSVAVPDLRPAPSKSASRVAQFLTSCATIGAICESSRWLGKRMARAVEGTSLPIVELGAGYGAVTRFLPSHAVSIEREAQRFNHLKTAFPERAIIDTCAVAFMNELAQPTAVVSSIPSVNNPEFGELRASVSRAFKNGMIGQFVVYTYFPVNPFAGVFPKGEMIGYEMRNLPPAFVWSYSC